MTDEVRQWWNEESAQFQADIDLPIAVNWDGFGWLTEDDLGLLGDVEGVEVVELGCGGGQCAVALAKRGAVVTGVDFSSAQLAYATDVADEHGVDVDFVLTDIQRLESLSADSFDVAFNSYVFQWVDDLEACFDAAARVLRPGGRFVFAIPHPFYDVVDPETHVVEESYFDTGRHVLEQREEGADLVVYRHTVSEVFDALSGAGFAVEEVLEPGSSNPADYEPGPWGERTPELMSKLPSTLIFVAETDV